MSDVIIPYRFQVKRDTAAAFTAANTLLREGEFGLETDTRKLKLGDGSTAWNALGYLDASFWPYDNTTSGLAATDVQAAVDELADEKLGDAPSDGTGYVRKNGVWAAESGGSGSGAMTLVDTVTAAGGETALTMSGLDLAADGSYILQVVLKNATASLAVISCFFNGDTTATNYDTVNVQAKVGASFTPAYTNAATFGVLNASSSLVGQAFVCNDLGGKTSADWSQRSGETTAIEQRWGVMMWRTAANVNSITLSASVASSMAVGSYFKVFKVE